MIKNVTIYRHLQLIIGKSYQRTKKRSIQWVTNCKACALQYSIQQQHFPGRTFSLTTKVAESVKQIIQGNSSLQNPAVITTRQILEEIEPQFKKAYQSTKEPGTKVQIKPTANEKKKFKRKMQRNCRDAMNEQFLNADPLQVLSEGQSLQGI